MSESRRSRADSRLSLILAAERHFALHGIAEVPLKAIHLAAGHHNASATHYHFGSRQGLINAILDHRMPVLNQRRIDRLAALKAGGTPTLRGLVAVWVEPLGDELRPRRGGNYYLRFLERLRREVSTKFATRVSDLQSGYIDVFRAISQHLASLPVPIVRSRLGIAGEQIVSSLASLEAEFPSGKKRHVDFPSLAISNLIDYITAGLSAPQSAETKYAATLPPSDIDFHFQFLPRDWLQ